MIEEKKEKLFLEGMKQFKGMDYFDAHEAWEDLWSDYYLEDRKFVQGLIQLAVSFVHIGNGNMTGAKNLLRKCKEKFQDFSGVHRVNTLSSTLFSNPGRRNKFGRPTAWFSAHRQRIRW